MCVPSITDLSERLLSLESRLLWSLAARRVNDETALLAASRRLMAACPAPRVRERRIDIETAAIRMRRAATDQDSRGKQRVAVSGEVLAALDPDSRAATRLRGTATNR